MRATQAWLATRQERSSRHSRTGSDRAPFVGPDACRRGQLWPNGRGAVELHDPDALKDSAGIEERVAIRLRGPFGSSPITGTVGPEPSEPSVVGTLDRPSVLVDEPMVEPADEQQIVEVG